MADEKSREDEVEKDDEEHAAHREEGRDQRNGEDEARGGSGVSAAAENGVREEDRDNEKSRELVDNVREDRRRERSEEEEEEDEEDNARRRRRRDDDDEDDEDDEDAERSKKHRGQEPSRRERVTRTLDVDKDDAAFVLGRGGTTKRKIARVSGAEIELDERALTITMTGSPKQCDYAEDYITFIRQQRVGPVTIDVSTSKRDDFTAYAVPSDCIGFVMGRNGQTLRSMEEEWGVLMFFAKTSAQRGGETEQLCIFGPLASRRGAELKTMSAVEHKHPGYCVDPEINELRQLVRVEGDEDSDGWGTDTVPLSEENFSYALGSQGSTRRKLAAASGCIIEYVGRLACFSGYKRDRRRGKDYLRWLLEQRTGQSMVQKPEEREDCTIVKVPSKSVAFLTGYRGESLRGIERESNTFCFTDGDRSQMRDADRTASGNDEERAKSHENLLIFSYSRSAREHARDIVEDRLAEHKRLGGPRSERSRRYDDDDRRPSRRGGYAPPSEACWDYQRRRCNRGDNCRFSHNVPRDDDSYDDDRRWRRDRSRSRERRSRRDDRSPQPRRDSGRRRRRDDYSDDDDYYSDDDYRRRRR